jgi:MmyB-like transcription regulator ligand binding domain
MDTELEVRDFLTSRRSRITPQQIADALRIEAGRNPFDRDLRDLIGELAACSSEFGARWARHNVRLHRTAVKRLHNNLVGDIELTGTPLRSSATISPSPPTPQNPTATLSSNSTSLPAGRRHRMIGRPPQGPTRVRS